MMLIRIHHYNFQILIIQQRMGGSESVLKDYIKLYGLEALFKIVILQKKIDWLQGDCSRQINRKLEDEVRYILFQMDQFINSKKENSIEQYKTSKSVILQRQPTKVKSYQQRHGKSLQNIYGKNDLMDRLNLMKINFHIQVHITKKRLKKVIEQKLASIETHLLYQQKQISSQKQTLVWKQMTEKVQKDNKFQSQIIQKFPELKKKLQEFKLQIIEEFNFNEIFWPHYDSKVRQTQLQVEKICNEVEKNTNHMKKDLMGVWNFLTFK